MLGATVKGNYKRHWVSPDPTGELSGIGAAFYFLLHDTREKYPMLVNMLHLKGSFNRMRKRHEIWKKKYPDSEPARGPAFTGLANTRADTKALSRPVMDLKKLPFDPLEYIDYELPYEKMDPDLGQ